jgi:hypothetical protein
MSVLSTVTTETRVAGSDLCRTQTFYAAAADIEKMTNDFSALFARTSHPTPEQLYSVQQSTPTELKGEGFDIVPDLKKDQATLDALGLGPNPVVTVPTGPFAGLIATVTPYILTATATNQNCGGQVRLQREMNNYLIPLFQFGMFSNEDIELHPGPAFSFNGRVHANGNIYVNGNVTFLNKVTTANELVTDVLRNGSVRSGATVSMQVTTPTGSINVPITMGSVVNGPNLPGATNGQRGYFPTSPSGTANANWSQTVTAAKAGKANQFGGQLQTRTTGGAPLLLPLQLDGNPTREIIKRRMPNDNQTLSESRYHSKAEIRILIDDEGVANDACGTRAAQNGDGVNNLGVDLSTFKPSSLPTGATSLGATGGGRALWRINDNGQYIDTAATAVQQPTNGTSLYADTVRGVHPRASSPGADGVYGTGDDVLVTKTSAYGARIPSGAGLTGHILIQVVDGNGVARDVTQQILSMGVTEGEPNSIVQLQRPLWAAFVQGSRDASGLSNVAPDGTVYSNSLTDILNKTYIGADGEIRTNAGPTQSGLGYLTSIQDDSGGGIPQRSDTPPSLNLADWGANNCGSTRNKDCWSTNGDWNAIVPISVYNVREGDLSTNLNQNTVYERGMTSVVEVNMRNLARWLDGVYDANLLQGTPAVSANIGSPDGYILYVSDRRGDNVKTERDSGGNLLNMTNGMADNEDIYGPNGALDAGEDVIDSGSDDVSGPKKNSLQKDTAELPDPAALPGTYGSDRNKRALTAAAWNNPSNYFRRAVRLFNGENLQVTGAANKLSTTKGITVSSENMVYIWGNYNTTGINAAPPNGVAALNNPASPYRYTGNQVPSSIVCDAFFPISKTWFDATSALYPDTIANRPADNALTAVTSETSVRAGIIAGNNLSALSGNPDQGNGADSRLSGGLHNFPRFLEDWNTASRRWNFVGSLIPLYHSTQAMGPWWYVNPYSIYYAPIRDWAFDDTFTNPNQLPPGTPSFQHIEPTGFRQIL